MKYYEILKIDNKATAEEIKTAYRKLSKEYHPDVNNDVDAEDHFKMIKEAYEVLSDPVKRKSFDLFGSSIKGVEEEVLKFLTGHVLDHLLNYYDVVQFLTIDFVQVMKDIVVQQDMRQAEIESKERERLEKTKLFIERLSGSNEVSYITNAYDNKQKEKEAVLQQILEQREFLKVVMKTLNELNYKTK
jgi:DnaJ-class molecular chaperone